MKFNNETLRAAVKEWLDDESKAEKKYGHISDWDTSEVTDMSMMLDGAESFNQPLEKWDVSQVTDMSYMFDGAASFNQPLEKWDVSQVTKMNSMFNYASSFNQPLEQWDVSKVKDMNFMFRDATSFNQPLEKWDVSNVTDMSGMFARAKSFNQPLEKWDVSQVTGMCFMFNDATSFNQPLEKWDVSNVTDMSGMFGRAKSFNQPLEKWDVSKVTDMSRMFYKAESFNQPLEKWDVSKVTDMSDMFDGAASFTHQAPKRNQDVQVKSWIEIIQARAKSMNREQYKRWTTEPLLSFVAGMHYEEYVSRLADESNTDKIEFSRIRMLGFGEAYEHFSYQLDKERNGDSLIREELEELIFHAHSSFLAAMRIALDAGMNEDLIKQITPLGIMRELEVQSVASQIRNAMEEFEFTPGDKLNEFSYDQLRKGNYNVAISNARKALEKTPNHAPFLDTLAFALFLNDEYKSALDISNQAIELDIKSGELNPEHLSTRIKIYQALSNHPKVKEDEKRLNEIAPDYNDPLHVLEIITIKKQNS